MYIKVARKEARFLKRFMCSAQSCLGFEEAGKGTGVSSPNADASVLEKFSLL